MVFHNKKNKPMAIAKNASSFLTLIREEDDCK